MITTEHRVINGDTDWDLVFTPDKGGYYIQFDDNDGSSSPGIFVKTEDMRALINILDLELTLMELA